MCLFITKESNNSNPEEHSWRPHATRIYINKGHSDPLIKLDDTVEGRDCLRVSSISRKLPHRCILIVCQVDIQANIIV